MEASTGGTQMEILLKLLGFRVFICNIERGSSGGLGVGVDV